ncbi:unnamed protein product [Caenorhabditis bovis]|uniref:Uncharacterized protein n=1 Tax=Caenorhabditis bovis TaxID=2654633 RepID=A0A8S1EFZ6_9PELO|nr:unnamed protein product [Caenorhabditis bovis]
MTDFIVEKMEEDNVEPSDASEDQMTNQKSDSKGERSVVLLGTKHKDVFFKQLCNAAEKYERHVHYQDVHYLTVDHMGTEQVIEVSDPGLGRTGGREMALRVADYVILYYSSMSIESLQAIQKLSSSLQVRKNMPILILCDSDEILMNDETSSANTSSTSEGYESDEREGMKRHFSMEQIRKSLDDTHLAIDQGEKLAEELGSKSSYMKISSSNLDDARKVLTHIVLSLNKSAPQRGRRKSLIKDILRSSKNKESLEPSSIQSDNNKKRKSVDESKVCIIM